MPNKFGVFYWDLVYSLFFPSFVSHILFFKTKLSLKIGLTKSRSCMSVCVLQIRNKLKIRILNLFVKYALCPITNIKLSVLQGDYFHMLCCAFTRSSFDPKLVAQNIKCIYVCYKTCIGNTPLQKNQLYSTNFKKLVAKHVQLQLQLQKM
jgi:hypothetical protein